MMNFVSLTKCERKRAPAGVYGLRSCNRSIRVFGLEPRIRTAVVVLNEQPKVITTDAGFHPSLRKGR